MLTQDEKNKLLVEIDSQKTKISQIKSELDAINKSKEEWFNKKEDFKKKIQNQINSIKNLKQQRDNLTSEVKLSKQEREKIEAKLPELESRYEQLKKKRDEMAEKLGIRKDFGKLRKEIEQMQDKIQTMPMSFSAEKKLMATIKQRKKELKDADQIKDINIEIKNVSSELSVYKNIRNISHSKVQNIAKTSQIKHVSMLEQSKEIDEMKNKEQEAFEKFKELKDKAKEKSDLMRDEVNKMSDLYKKLGVDKKEYHEKKEKETKQNLAERRREVEDKIKKKGKLTTEDLLVLQSEDMN